MENQHEKITNIFLEKKFHKNLSVTACHYKLIESSNFAQFIINDNVQYKSKQILLLQTKSLCDCITIKINKLKN